MALVTSDSGIPQMAAYAPLYPVIATEILLAIEMHVALHVESEIHQKFNALANFCKPVPMSNLMEIPSAFSRSLD